MQLFSIDPAQYRPHPLHGTDRDWTETNCWQDMMIEVIHCLGHEPLSALAFTLGIDFEGDQWTLGKFPVDDLRRLFGIDIIEIYVWRPIVDHIEDNLAIGRLVTVEVDAFHLPDTAGITYRIGHVKTGIVAQMVDRSGHRLGYFHNAGYFELGGEDFDALFAPDRQGDSVTLPPYVETIKLERLRPDPAPVSEVLALAREHLGRRPESNPVTRFGKRLESDLASIREQGEGFFHSYSFATFRQLGSASALATSFLWWLAGEVPELASDLAVAAGHCARISEVAKGLEFAVARVARGRSVDLEAPLGTMERAWEGATETLAHCLGR